MSFSQRGGQLGCCRGWGAAGAGSSTGFWPQVKTSADGKRVPFFCANPGGSRSPLGTAACCQTPACRGRRDPNPFQRRFGTAQDSRNVLSTGKPGGGIITSRIPQTLAPLNPCRTGPLHPQIPATPLLGEGNPQVRSQQPALLCKEQQTALSPTWGSRTPTFLLSCTRMGSQGDSCCPRSPFPICADESRGCDGLVSVQGAQRCMKHPVPDQLA